MPRSNKGFTLVEVLVAAVVLALIALPMTGLLASAARASSLARRSDDALRTAQTRLEETLLISAAADMLAQNGTERRESGGLRSVVSVTDIGGGLLRVTAEVFEGATSLSLLEGVLYVPK